MESKAKFLGHPIHQTLIVLPLGSLAMAVVFDIVYLMTGSATMAVVAFWLIVAGIIAGLLAAPFGTIDWLSIPKGTRAKRVGLMHGVGNVIVLLLFLVSLGTRIGAVGAPSGLAILFSIAGAALAVVTGWLGGELVDRLGVGVSDDAHLDARSSLAGSRR